MWYVAVVVHVTNDTLGTDPPYIQQAKIAKMKARLSMSVHFIGIPLCTLGKLKDSSTAEVWARRRQRSQIVAIAKSKLNFTILPMIKDGDIVIALLHDEDGVFIQATGSR